MPAIPQVTPTKENRVGDGDRERFELLYAAHYDRVLAYTLCRAEVDVARDATAETFLVAWRRLDDVPEESLPWLIGVARRCLADQRRSSGRREALAARLGQTAGAGSAWQGDPAETVIERNHVVAGLRRLGPADRELLCLVAWDGLSAGEAARSLGCSRATFAVRLHRARRRLAAALDADEAGGPARRAPGAMGRGAGGRALAVVEPAGSGDRADSATAVGLARPIGIGETFGALDSSQPRSAPVFSQVRVAGGALGVGPVGPVGVGPVAHPALSVRPEEAS